MLSGFSFRSAFIFSINSLILSGFPLTSFYFTETSLFADLVTFTEEILNGKLRLLCSVTTFLQSICFNCTTWKRKQTTKQQPHRACERTKSKQKQNQAMSHSNSPRVLLFDLAHKQYNSVIKRQLHCLMSESKGTFLLKIYINVWLSKMSGHGVNSIFFNKKNKDWTYGTLANPPTTPPLLILPPSDSISFLPQPPIPPPPHQLSREVDVICVSRLNS